MYLLNNKKLFYQYDINQKIGVGDGIIYVDYDSSPPVRVAVQNMIAKVPDEWLQTSGAKRVWLCEIDGTRHSEIITVCERPMPPNYIFTPTEKVTFESLKRQVEQGTANANQVAQACLAVEGHATEQETARASAETARASAETARASAETARASAETARASAETARASAETTRASAETARASAETARASAETARATKWGNISATTQTLDEGTSASVQTSQDDNGTHFTFLLPRGNTGNCYFANIFINPQTGKLYAKYTHDNNNIQFILTGGRLGVYIA